MPGMSNLERDRKFLDFLAVAIVLGNLFGFLSCCRGIGYVVNNHFTS
jgi:hypothetical protein